MVNQRADDLDGVFRALADSTRRGILERLADGEATVTELAAPFSMSLPAISKHLKVLENAGLLSRRIDGRVHRCHLQATAMREATKWMDGYRRFWESQLDALEAYFVPPPEEAE